MKRTLALILCAALWLAACGAAGEASDGDAPLVSAPAATAAPSAAVRTPEGFSFRTLEGGEAAELTGYDGTQMRITLPEAVSFDGGATLLPVTRLAAWAFEGSPVEAVTVPEGVTEIGAYCFSECRSLESITLPESLESLDSCAFMLCTALETVTLPAALTRVGDNPFCYCTHLETILLEGEGKEGVHPALDFADGMLTDRAQGRLITRLSTAEGESFTPPEGCTLIGAFALANNRGLRSAEIPGRVAGLGRYAFYHCTALRSVTVSGQVGLVEEGCFALCHEELVITTPEDSAAWRWGLSNGVPVEAPALPDKETSPTDPGEDPEAG